MSDNIITFPAATRAITPELATHNIHTMLWVDCELPENMTGVEGVGALLIRTTKGCVRTQDRDTTWPAGFVDHVRGLLPPLAEIAAGAAAISGPIDKGPEAPVPAAYVHMLLGRIGHLEVANELAATRTKAEISDLLAPLTFDNPAGAA